MSRTPHTRILAALTAAGVLLLTGCQSDGTATDTTPTPSSSASTSSTAEPSESTSTSTSPSPSPEQVTAGVYFIEDTRAGFRLTREIRDLSAADPAKTAVETMIAGPEDPDYSTTWNPDTEVLGVTTSPRRVVVNLSADARRANAGSEVAALMIQQLVYTATEAADTPKAKVLLQIDGKPAGELWGAVEWTKPIGRADPLDVRVLVQIDSPSEGASATSPLTITGEAAAFEANVPWRILRANGTVLRTGFTMTTEGQTFAPFSFTVKLKPGTYTVEISEDDPSGGEGGTPMTDTRTVTIS